MSIRTDRLGNIMLEEISKIIRDEVKDPDIGFVTINCVKVSSDLSYAKVYFTTLNGDKNNTVNALNRASNFIRSELCQRIDDLRKMPEFTFIYDESIEYGEKIEKIISQVKEEE